MEIRNSRLFKTLKSIGAEYPQFEITSQVTPWKSEDEITEISITRGKSNRGGGINPSTLEYSVFGKNTDVTYGHTVNVSITQKCAEAIIKHAGSETIPDTIKNRFTGRYGETSITDAWNHQITTYLAASWTSQFGYSQRLIRPAQGKRLSEVWHEILGTGTNDQFPGVNLEVRGNTEFVAKTEDKPLSVSEVFTKYCGDLGYLVQERRNGQVVVCSTAWRESEAIKRVKTELPLTRSQAISPAKFERKNLKPSTWVTAKVTNENGNLAEYRVLRSNQAGMREIATFDWEHIRLSETWEDSQLWRESWGIANETSPTLFTIPSIKIDLLYLLSSKKTYHRQQAVNLLALEHGDPIFFSGDWDGHLRGTHFAEGIKETITPDVWEIEISLVPWQVVIGNYENQIPAPRIWEQATEAWDQNTQKWNEA